MENTQPYSVLVGVGSLYVAPVGSTFPDVDATPTDPWNSMGQTDGGITVTLEQTLDQHRSDQNTGPVKVTRSEENMVIEANLLEATLENLARVLTEEVADTPPGAGTIGTRALNLYRGFGVKTMALLFRGEYQSPYGNWPAQWEVPYGYFDGAVEIGYSKTDHIVFLARFVALVDPNAASPAERFGKLIVQDAEAE